MRSLRASRWIATFYSLIHFEGNDLGVAIRELRRVLAPGGMILAAFHIGDQTVHLDELFGKAVSLDFHFLMPGHVVAELEAAGFAVIETVEREPYADAEHPSRRCYLLARVP